MIVKCNCNHCSTHLEFDSANAGQVIACPSCGMETQLYIPPPALPSKVKTPAQKIGNTLRPCRACGNSVSVQAKVCPACGHPVPRRVNFLKVLIVSAVGFLIVLWIAAAIKNEPETSNKRVQNDPVDAAIAKAAKDESLDAYLTACEYCKIYAPSGNNFTTQSGAVVTEGHARWVTNDYGVPNWIAVGYVDSQNELGAMRHQKWFASVVPNGEKWKLMFLKIGDEDFVNHYESR